MLLQRQSGFLQLESTVVQTLLSFFFDTILADSLKIYFILLFSFSKCPLLLIKVDFYWEFALNKYSLRACLQPFTTTNIQYLMTTSVNLK
jgi:hypothetical protein